MSPPRLPDPRAVAAFLALLLAGLVVNGTCQVSYDAPRIAVGYDRSQSTAFASMPAVVGCPAGWTGNVAADDLQAHTQSSCSRDGWTVYLDADGRFWRAWDGRSGVFTLNPVSVPGWRE